MGLPKPKYEYIAQSKSLGEQGLVAIFSVIMIMGILTLLMVGFTNVIRQAQNRTLNDQLNMQALYAAETAINDATNVLRANLSSLSSFDKTSCAPNTTFNDNVLDAQLGIEYSCLLIDTSPTELRFDNVSEAVYSRVRTASGDGLRSLSFKWDSPVPTHTANSLQFSAGCQVGNPRLPTATTWGNGIGIMRVDLLPVANYGRQQLVDGSYSFFLYPTSDACAPLNNSMTILPGQANQGSTLITRCAATGDYRCSGTVQLNGAVSSDYYVRLESFYNNVVTELSATTVTGSLAELIQGQALIDATGSVNGVFKRIRAHVPIGIEAFLNNAEQNSFALLSGESICKRLIGAPPTAGIGGSVDIDNCGTLNP